MSVSVSATVLALNCSRGGVCMCPCTVVRQLGKLRFLKIVTATVTVD